MNAAVVPPHNTSYNGPRLPSEGCTGTGYVHGAAVDAAVSVWARTGSLPSRNTTDPCAATAVSVMTAAGWRPVAAQLRLYDDRARVGTAVDVVVVTPAGDTLFVELKTTMYPTDFFEARGTFRNLTLPYSFAGAAVLQALLPTVWVRRLYGLPQPRAVVLVVGPGGWARLLWPRPEFASAAERVAGLL